MNIIGAFADPVSVSTVVSDVFTVAGSALEFVTSNAVLTLFAIGVPLVSIGFSMLHKAKRR